MISILIAQPTSGSVTAGTVKFLSKLFQSLTDHGHDWAYETLALPDAAHAKNVFASYVISDNAFTHVLFVDPDVGFPPDAILRLIDFEVSIAAVACPAAYLPWDGFRRVVERNAGSPDAQPSTASLLDAALEFDVMRQSFDGADWLPERKGRFLSVPAVGSGLMLVHRDVFEIMLARACAVARPGHDHLPLLNGAPYCDFFSAQTAPEDGTILSPDVSFCKRWVADCGGQIWIDLQSRVMRYGVRGHPGRYADRAAAHFPETDD